MCSPEKDKEIDEQVSSSTSKFDICFQLLLILMAAAVVKHELTTFWAPGETTLHLGFCSCLISASSKCESLQVGQQLLHVSKAFGVNNWTTKDSSYVFVVCPRFPNWLYLIWGMCSAHQCLIFFFFFERSGILKRDSGAVFIPVNWKYVNCRVIVLKL